MKLLSTHHDLKLSCVWTFPKHLEMMPGLSLWQTPVTFTLSEKNINVLFHGTDWFPVLLILTVIVFFSLQCNGYIKLQPERPTQSWCNVASPSTRCIMDGNKLGDMILFYVMSSLISGVVLGIEYCKSTMRRYISETVICYCQTTCRVETAGS